MEKNRVLPVSHALVFLLIHLGTGLAAPVLSLMLLARGATLATLPFVVGVTTVVTCLLEVPSVPVFVAVYVALYLALGARSVIEQTVLHNAVPSRERSGMASVQSIALRAGGLAGSTVSGPAVAALTLAGAWPVLAALAVALVALGVRRR